MPSVFLSYAQADEERVAEFREKLKTEAPDIDIKQDRLSLHSLEFLILCITAAALASLLVQKEWRYTRQQGVSVYPIKGGPDQELAFDKMPHWMSRSISYAPVKEWPGIEAGNYRPAREGRGEFANDADIVLYCGCCAMDTCPSLRPAYRKLREGLRTCTRAELPTNMHEDWFSKGYPSESGSTVGTW